MNSKVGNAWLDYPILGVDSGTIYIGGNYFSLSGSQPYTQSEFWTIDKAALETGQAATPVFYNPTSLGAPFTDLYTPAHMYGSQAGLNGNFLVEYDQNNSGADTLRIIRFESATSGSPTHNFRSLTVGNISDLDVVGARQLGTSHTLDAGDGTVQNAVWRNDKFYVTTEIRVGTGSSAHDVVHWFVVDTTNLNNLTLVSQGNIDEGASFDTYYGNMTVDAAGSMIVGFSISGSTIYVSSAYALISAGGTALQDNGGYLAQGQGTYSGGRWGDYSGVAIDPTDGNSFWMFNEYATSSESWATTIGGYIYTTTFAATTVQNDYLAITRTALPPDQATTIANAINAGTQTETQYVNGLPSPVANTSIPAVAVEASMYGATGTSAEITFLTISFLPPQVANATHNGLNPLVYASEALGLVFAFGNENNSTTFSSNFGPSNSAMPNSTAGDAAFAMGASSSIFGTASTANLVDVLQGFVSNWKTFYHCRPTMS